MPIMRGEGSDRLPRHEMSGAKGFRYSILRRARQTDLDRGVEADPVAL